jgi:predicted acylesterase/phospholipase RssA
MEKYDIKHLVLSGGGIPGLTVYSILRESHKFGFWNIDTLQSIYGTSIGAMMGVFVSLKYDWSELDNYIINRPWENVFKIDIGNVLQSMDTRGLFTRKMIEDILYPLLKGKDLDTSITMLELYEYSKIELHIFTTELYEYSTIDISYKTHPKWKLIDALYCSVCLPIFFAPHLNDAKCYLDGGLTNNYPIYDCLDNCECPDSVFGITIHKKDNNKTITESTTMFDYLIFILTQMYNKAHISSNSIRNKKYEKLTHEIILENTTDEIYDFIGVASSKEKRSALLDKGVQIWNDYNSLLLVPDKTNCSKPLLDTLAS